MRALANHASMVARRGGAVDGEAEAGRRRRRQTRQRWRMESTGMLWRFVESAEWPILPFCGRV